MCVGKTAFPVTILELVCRNPRFAMTTRSVIILLIVLGADWLNVFATVPEAVVADASRWPLEITVTSATRADVLRDGQPSGAMLLGAGKTLRVLKLTSDHIIGRSGSTDVSVPVEKTDLLQRLGLVNGAVVASSPAPSAAKSSVSPVAQPAPAARKVVAPYMQRSLAGRLSRLNGERLLPLPADALNGVKYYALYFSAGWCGPCRKFTPELVTAYRELKAAYPEFELVFVSSDNSAADMVDYMREKQMPWPAVSFERRDEKLLSYSGPGIPCLVVVNAMGQVLADSFEGENYLGPQHVLRELRRLLKRGS